MVIVIVIYQWEEMVRVALEPLEFSDCHLDSPKFRENLHRHEKELDKTSTQIKRIIKEVKELLAAATRKKTAAFHTNLTQTQAGYVQVIF